MAGCALFHRLAEPQVTSKSGHANFLSKPEYMINKAILHLITGVTLVSCAMPKPVFVEPPQPAINPPVIKEYTISSPHGHLFKVEIQYQARNLSSLNNKCRAQYIVTNIGSKDFVRDERFVVGKQQAFGSELPQFAVDPRLIFEFTATDGKKFEIEEPMISDIYVGKSSEAREVTANIGLQTCVGTIRPIAVRYRKV